MSISSILKYNAKILFLMRDQKQFEFVYVIGIYHDCIEFRTRLGIELFKPIIEYSAASHTPS
jgi:hypothetical protein